MSVLREWKKVYEADLDSIIYELKDFLQTPAMVILTGDVGLGKTTFTKAFVRLNGDSKLTHSPTYSVVNELGSIVHADLYRLENAEEIVHLELPMYLDEIDYFFVEWGRAFQRELVSIVPREFCHYEILFELNESTNTDAIASRNIRLIKLAQD